MPNLFVLIAEIEGLLASVSTIFGALGKNKATIEDVNSTELDRALAEFDAAWNVVDAATGGIAVTGDLGAALVAYISAGGTPAGLVEGLGTLTTIGVGVDMALSYFDLGLAIINYEQNPNSDTQ